MQFDFKVKIKGRPEPIEVTAGPMAIVGWERKTKQKASSFAQAIGVEDMATLAYNQLKLEDRHGGDTLEQFIASLEDIDVIADPTPASGSGEEASPGESSS